jgi:hypothetical protein
LGALNAVLKLTDVAKACGTVELNFLRWIVKDGTSIDTLHAAFTKLRSTDPDTKGMAFIAAALQQVWQNDKALPLPLRVLKQFDEPDVLIITLLAARNGGSLVLDLESLYKTVFEGNLQVGDDEHGHPVSTEAFAVKLVEKLKEAQVVQETTKRQIEVFEFVGNEGAVLTAWLNAAITA